MQLLYFNPNALHEAVNRDLAGMPKFAEFSKIFKSYIAFVDRTGTITTPLNTRSMFPIPSFRRFNKTLEEICNERAKELLERAERANVPMYVFWSGGIDSTLVLVSLLKNATADQKKNITVLMNELSIEENPTFYREYVARELKRESSTLFGYVLGTDVLLVSGELNDQLFGAESNRGMMEQFGTDVVHKPFAPDTFRSFFVSRGMDESMAHFYVEIFERLKAVAPMPLLTNHDVTWWFSFAVKWQSVFLRTLGYAAKRNVRRVNASYVQERYEPFFNTEEFQLWSMNNLDKRIKDGWNTYKWPAKDIIYEFAKDKDYRDHKTKHGSLHDILMRQRSYNLIDQSFAFTYDVDVSPYHVPINDFV